MYINIAKLIVDELFQSTRAPGMSGIVLWQFPCLFFLFNSCSLYSTLSYRECHSHPLRFCVASTHIQHQGSLLSVTSPSANQQPVIHKSGTSGEVDRD